MERKRKINEAMRNLKRKNIELTLKYVDSRSKKMKEFKGILRDFQDGTVVVMENEHDKGVFSFVDSKKAIYSLEAFGVDVYQNKEVARHYLVEDCVSLEDQKRLLEKGNYIFE